MVLDLLVDALETGVAEFEQFIAFLCILHGLLTNVSLKDVRKELKAYSVVVLHQFVVCLHVLCASVADDAD